MRRQLDIDSHLRLLVDRVAASAIGAPPTTPGTTTVLNFIVRLCLFKGDISLLSPDVAVTYRHVTLLSICGHVTRQIAVTPHLCQRGLLSYKHSCYTRFTQKKNSCEIEILVETLVSKL